MELRVALCCVAKWEKPYIVEFVEYYRELGFSKIAIYDNNEPDGERMDDILSDSVSDGFVDIIDARGQKNIQTRAYVEYYAKHHMEFDWICFFDVDEYLLLKHDEDISSYLSRSCFDGFNCIHVNWMMFNDNDLVRYDSRPLRVRFTNCCPDAGPNIHIKSIVKCSTEVEHIRYVTPHNVDFVGIRVCDGSGNAVDNTWNVDPPVRDLVQINHYFTKTVEEYVTNRYNRGLADSGGQPSRQRLYDLFFGLCEVTDEKLKMFDECISDGNKGRTKRFIS